MQEFDEVPVIQVRFPDGVRPVRATIRRIGRECFAPEPDEFRVVTYEPMEMTGWLFVQGVDGSWMARPV